MLKSTTDCDIVINGENFGNQNPIFVDTPENCYITFLPHDKTRFFPLSTSIKNISDSTELKAVPFNTHTEITFDPTEIPADTKQKNILNKKYRNNIFTLFSSNKTFLNIDSINFSHKSTIPLIFLAEFLTHENAVTILGKSDSKTYVMLYDCAKKKVLLEICADAVEKTKNGIKIAKFTPSIAGFGTVYTFDYTEQKLSNFGVYKSENPTHTVSEKLVPLAFLEALKYGDYNLARHYLNADTVKNEHLKSYFGQIKNIYFNGLSKKINYTVESNGYKNYTFSVENGKILDIEENPLN